MLAGARPGIQPFLGGHFPRLNSRSKVQPLLHQSGFKRCCLRQPCHILRGSLPKLGNALNLVLDLVTQTQTQPIKESFLR